MAGGGQASGEEQRQLIKEPHRKSSAGDISALPYCVLGTGFLCGITCILMYLCMCVLRAVFLYSMDSCVYMRMCLLGTLPPMQTNKARGKIPSANQISAVEPESLTMDLTAL